MEETQEHDECAADDCFEAGSDIADAQCSVGGASGSRAFTSNNEFGQVGVL